jgi:small conductance mechanosensitive channel
LPAFSPFVAALQAAGPLGAGWVATLVEALVALLLIAVFGTLFASIVVTIAKKAGASRSVTTSVRQWILVLMVILGVAAVTTLTGFSSQFTTLTLSGIAGLAISLALQSTFSNIIAGVLMLNDGVLRLGDVLEFGSMKGEVVRLSLRTTWIKREDGVIVVVGNNNLSSGPIVNYTAKQRLTAKVKV